VKTRAALAKKSEMETDKKRSGKTKANEQFSIGFVGFRGREQAKESL
jgi:hypothetical protein